MKAAVDIEIIESLQKQILTLQGNRPPADGSANLGLGLMESSFPGNTFPQAAIHELISYSPVDASCTNAFISVVLGKLLQKGGNCIWVSRQRKIYPPALKIFGIDPERILFVDAWKLKDALWVIEESLKCDALKAVVGEIGELNFNDSRRLQLTVEKSKVTGFIHRHQPKQLNALACVSRWKIRSAPSSSLGQMPGLGFPKWEAELLKARNGKPGKWTLQWSPQGLEYITEKEKAVIPIEELKIA
jgi:protein ImuA